MCPPRAPLPAYSQRHLNPAHAAAYREKFKRSLTRRLSTRRETALVARALDQALDWLEQAGGPARESVRLLDYPCGAGRFAPLAAGRVGGYLAGDHSPHMLELAARALESAGLASRQLGSTEGDARSMQLDDKVVDVALCMRLLHHFPERDDRIAILTELARVTRGPLVTSFLDASSRKQRRHVKRLAQSGQTSRRVLSSPAEFDQEARAAGWRVAASWSLSSLFSGQRIALCLPAEPLAPPS